MARRKTLSKPSSYDFSIRPDESPEAYYKRLAKVADQRLVRLEKLEGQKGYKKVTSYSYKKAMRDIDIYNPGGHRFNTGMIYDINKETGAKTLDKRILKERTMSVLDFLQAPTSTKAGIDEAFRRRVETMNKNWGTDFTWQEMADFFEKKQADKIFGQFAGNSEPAMKAIAVIRKTEKALKEGIEENLNFTLTGPEKEAVIKVLWNRKYVGGRTYDKELKEQIKDIVKKMETDS